MSPPDQPESRSGSTGPSRIHRWTRPIVDAYAVAVVLFFLLRWVERGWLPPVTVARQLLPFLLGGAALALPAALALRRWAPSLALAGAVFAFVPLVWTPLGAGLDADVEAPAGERLRMVTLNLGNRVARPDEVVAFVRESGADVVALQELSASQANAIEAELSDLYPHQVLYGWGCPGSGILSRTPIRSHEWLSFTSPRAHLVAVVEFAGREVTIFAVHSRAWVGPFGSLSSDARDWPALARAVADSAPALLAGDLNTTEFSHGYAAFPAAGLADAFRAVDDGFGYTFPLPGRYHGLPAPPFLRIDYVWHTPDLFTEACWIGPDASSDHLPLFVEVVVPIEPGA